MSRRRVGFSAKWCALLGAAACSCGSTAGGSGVLPTADLTATLPVGAGGESVRLDASRPDCAGDACASSPCKCPGGEMACGKGCTDTSSDPLNCGSCGNVCTSGMCSSGACLAVPSVEGGTSCGSGLAATCGPASSDNCCKSLWVSGGMYYRSYDVAMDGTYSCMSYPATVSGFYLDKYEVTVGRFRQFVNTGMGTQASPPASGTGANPHTPGSGWQPAWNTHLTASTSALETALQCYPTYTTWTNSPGPDEDRPIVCVTWYEAFAFCAWDGGFLPTEAEWNYAAAGGGEQRAYPWSSPAGSLSIDCTYANYGGTSWPSTACVSTGTSNVGFESPKGDGRWGQSDLAGNVWEWAVDWVATYGNPCVDCAELSGAGGRVVRGGSFGYNASTLRSGYRDGEYPPGRGNDIGFRCARAH